MLNIEGPVTNYQLFRIRVAPINIPETYQPMSAEELLAQIQIYRATYS
ncbi:MAG: hypothetical protein JWL77_1736 [Chthonomonadaceae bacterium]|jgi:hypothetical protein|nr:hypothetical protein [Chthonomonadaceae bacterium]